MIDGLELQGRCCVIALGITTEGIGILFLIDGEGPPTNTSSSGTSVLKKQ